MPETATKLPPLEVAENAGGGICIYEVGEEDYPIARMNATRDVPVARVRAEAEAIVRACNAHAAMLAELKRAEWSAAYGSCPACSNTHPDEDGSGHRPDCTLAAALALATEGV